MLSLKSSDHFFKIGKELFEDEEFGDLIFKTGSSTISAHSHLLLQHVPLLSSLLCDHCRHGHEQVVIILPNVESEFVEIALMEFYLKGDSRKLNCIFSETDVINNQREKVDSINTATNIKITNNTSVDVHCTKCR